MHASGKIANYLDARGARSLFGCVLDFIYSVRGKRGLSPITRGRQRKN